MVVEVAGTGASSLPQSRFILTLQSGQGQSGLQPSSALERGDDQVPNLSVRQAEWEGSPHLQDQETEALRGKLLHWSEEPSCSGLLGEASLKGGDLGLGATAKPGGTREPGGPG